MQLKTKILILSLFFIFPLLANGATFDKNEYFLGDNPIISYDTFFGSNDTAVLIFQNGFLWGQCFDVVGGSSAIIEDGGNFCFEEELNAEIPQSDLSAGSYTALEFDRQGGAYIDCNVIALVGSFATITPQACTDFIVANGGNVISSSYTVAEIITGIRFISTGVRDSTATNLGANVVSSVGSLFPIVLLSIGVFLAFYIIERIMFMFPNVEKATVRKGRRRKND